MRIGSSIVLIALGAILAFALAPGLIPYVNQVVIGYILMVVGVLGLIVSLIMAASTRRTVVHGRAGVDDLDV
ncbi:hypothetical protein [Sinomonas susongensis]|uniref:hypothetical protein n=1 Tax=Sinomonas susongensis TaxID=1324851 RepID=UPI001109F1B8|nr:hypothetical protein [Sinomonas susongensis]